MNDFVNLFRVLDNLLGAPMSQVTIYDPDNVVAVINGAPPADQSAQIAALTQQVSDLTAQVQTVTGERDALQVKVDNAKAALA